MSSILPELREEGEAMSCEYCEEKNNTFDGTCCDGEFTIYHDGDKAFMEYELLSIIFDNEIRIYDAVPIKYCPMCGEKL